MSAVTSGSRPNKRKKEDKEVVNANACDGEADLVPSAASSSAAAAASSSASASSAIPVDKDKKEEEDEEKPKKKKPRKKTKDPSVIQTKPDSDGFVGSVRIRYLCGYLGCDEKFESHEERSKHETSQHSLDKEDASAIDDHVSKEFRCRIIDCAYVSAASNIYHDSKERDTHERTVHKVNNRTVTADNVSLFTGRRVASTEEEDARQYTCPYCQAVVQKIKRHQQRNCPKNPSRHAFKCVYVGCPETFATSEDRVAHHSEKHSNEPSDPRELLPKMRVSLHVGAISCRYPKCGKVWNFTADNEAAYKRAIKLRSRHVWYKHWEESQKRKTDKLLKTLNALSHSDGPSDASAASSSASSSAAAAASVPPKKAARNVRPGIDVTTTTTTKTSASIFSAHPSGESGGKEPMVYRSSSSSEKTVTTNVFGELPTWGEVQTTKPLAEDDHPASSDPFEFLMSDTASQSVPFTSLSQQSSLSQHSVMSSLNRTSEVGKMLDAAGDWGSVNNAFDTEVVDAILAQSAAAAAAAACSSSSAASAASAAS